jgi:hypothetical protein
MWRFGNYLRDSAGPRSLVLDISIAHDVFGSSSHVLQNGNLTHPQDLDGPLRVAAQRKINAYGQQYADNQNIYFLPAIMSASTRMHGEFLRLLFLQAHRETEAHFTAAGMSSQNNYQSDSFRFKRAAFSQSLKSKIGRTASKAAALRINLNIEGCGIVAAPVHAPSRAPLLLPLLLSHNIPPPRCNEVTWTGKVTVHEMGHELLIVLEIDSVCFCSCFGRSPPPSKRNTLQRGIQVRVLLMCC